MSCLPWSWWRYFVHSADLSSILLINFPLLCKRLYIYVISFLHSWEYFLSYWKTLLKILTCACILTCSVFTIAVSNVWALHETLWFPLNWFVCLYRTGDVNLVPFFICADLPSAPPFVDSLSFLQCMAVVLGQNVGDCCQLCGFPSGSWVIPHWSTCLSLSFCYYHAAYINMACSIIFRWDIIQPGLFFPYKIALAVWGLLWFHMHFRIIFLVPRNTIESFEEKLLWLYGLFW